MVCAVCLSAFLLLQARDKYYGEQFFNSFFLLFKISNQQNVALHFSYERQT